MTVLSRFKIFLIKLIDFNITHSKLVVAVFIFLISTLMFFFKPLSIDITIDKLINKDFQSSKDYAALKKEFNIEKAASILIIARKPFTESDFCTIRKSTQELIFSDGNFINYFSPIYLRRTEYKNDSAIPILNFPLAINLNCESSNLVNFTSIDASPWSGIAISQDHRAIIHQIELQNTDSFNYESDKLPLKFKTLMDHTKSLSRLFEIHYLGDLSYQYFFKLGLDFNNNLNLLIILIIVIIFKNYYGTFLSSIIFILTLLFSCLILFTLMSIFNVPIDILNNSLILLLTVSSLGDFIFLSSVEKKNNQHWIESFKKIITPSFFTSFTTFIGFISLYSSDIEVVKRLGLWGGISGMIEWFVVMLILPSFLKLTLKNRTWVKKSQQLTFTSLNTFLLKIISPNFSKSLLILVLTIPFTIRNLNINDEPEKLFPKTHPFRISSEKLKSLLGFKNDISLVFNNKENIHLNVDKIEKISRLTSVARIENPYENLNYFTSKAPNKYKSTIEETLNKTPQFKRFFSSDKMRAIIYLRDINMKELENLRVMVTNTICEDKSCYLSGSLIAYADFSQKVPSTLIESFLWSIVLVFITIIFLAISTSNKKNIILLSLSSIWGVAITLLTIYLFHIQINFVTSVVISILVGMTGDNTIQYLLCDDDLNHGINQRYEASILNTLTMCACSLIFLMYYFEPPKTFGILLIIGLISSLIGDYWILKGLLKKSPEKYI